MKQKLLLLGAVLFGVLAFIFTFQQINQEKMRIQGAAEDIYLLQVTRDLSEDDKVTEDALKEVRVKRFKNSGDFTREVRDRQKNSVLDRQVRTLVRRGSFLQWSDLKGSVDSGKYGLNALIRPGFRAISISVDNTSSVSGLIQPNNYVDLIGTFRFPDTRGDSSLDTITLTILQRVRVIATGTDMGQIPAGTLKDARPRSYGTVTLELTPKEVEMIIFATQKGRLTLSLRNNDESAVTDKLQSVNWNYLQKNISAYMKERMDRIRNGR